MRAVRRKAMSAILAVAIGDVDVAGRCPDRVRRLVEGLPVRAALIVVAQREQDLAVGRELVDHMVQVVRRIHRSIRLDV